MKKIFAIFTLIAILSCKQEKKLADLIVTNANIYTVDDDFTTVEAFAVKDGKFIAVGSSEEVTNKYQSDSLIDAKGQTITCLLYTSPSPRDS